MLWSFIIHDQTTDLSAPVLKPDQDLPAIGFPGIPNHCVLPQEITKHLADDIRELRPRNNRVFYFFFKDDTFVLLHHFRKKSQKTPRREIERAISEMHDYLSRKEK